MLDDNERRKRTKWMLMRNDDVCLLNERNARGKFYIFSKLGGSVGLHSAYILADEPCQSIF